MWILLVLLMLFPSVSFASYTTATSQGKNQMSNGSVSVSVVFTGDAGEQPITRMFMISSDTMTQTAIEEWAGEQLANLNAIQNAAQLAIVQPNAVITTRTRPARAQTAKERWNADLEAYHRAKNAGIAAANADIAAMLADLESRYRTGFLDR